jgi:GDPmannose 4,6-dehydratase
LVDKKCAIVFGATGQDGAYLVEYLLFLGYKVVATRRRTSMLNTQRLDWVLQDVSEEVLQNLKIEYADVTDAISIQSLVYKYMPDEIYNLSAQSHVAISFEQPEYTANVNALGPLRILEASRLVHKQKKIKIYQASTSELFGSVLEWPQSEKTPFNVVSPYAAAKQFAHNMMAIYREAYGMYACSGILFNHESPIRGSNFVTKKIVRGLCEFKHTQTTLRLGNLNSIRDWGHAKDYVQMQHLMLQQPHPKDYVIGTGRQTTVREFVELTLKQMELQVEWQGSDETEIGICCSAENLKLVGKTIVSVDSQYFRPLEVDKLLADASAAKTDLNWIPETTLETLIKEMIEFENSKPSFDVI